MMQFTEQIQRAFEETVRSGVLSGADELPERLHHYRAPGCELDKLWADLLRHFKEGPRQPWATVLLETMRQDLAAAVAEVPAFPPVVTREDYAQELMANLLSAALEPPIEPARWTPNRLISRAGLSTQRWLAREIHGFAKRVGYIDRHVRSISGLGLPSSLELDIKRNPSPGLVALYRQEVLGDSIEEMAAECGLTENALRLRRRRAIKRIRRELDAA